MKLQDPPTERNPDEYILGKGVYDNFITVQPYCDEKVFRLDPAPVPQAAIWIYNALFMIAALGLNYAAYQFSEPGKWYWFAGAIFVVLVLTCVVFTMVTTYRFGREKELGPVLIYEKSTKCISLPREKVKFPIDDVLHVESITSQRFEETTGDYLSELNLVTRVDGKRERWPLLRSIAGVQSFDKITSAMLKETDIPHEEIFTERA